MTRATNAKKHPGQVVVNSGSRRPKGVVLAERTSRAAEKEKLAAVQEEGVNEVALIENNARKKKALGPDASGQRNMVTIPRVKRVRKPRAATPVDLGHSDNGHTAEAESPPEATKRNPSDSSSKQSTIMIATRPGDSPEESSTSGDSSADWRLQAAAAESESSDSDEGKDLEDEEPDTASQEKSNKKQKGRLTLRDRINDVATEFGASDITGPNLDVQKRKAGPNAGLGARPTPKKARKAEAPSGLVPSWTKFINIPSKPTGTRGASESRSISTTWVVSTRRANIPSAVTSHNEPKLSIGTDGHDDPAFTFGGLPSDEETVPKDSMKYPSESITRVNEIHSAPTNASQRAASEPSTNHARVKNSDLPPNTANAFATKVLPLAFQIAGILGPWEPISDEEIIIIWNLVFDSQHPIVSSEIKGDLFLAVKSLVKRGISAWLHRFAMAAEKALDAEFKCQDIVTLEDKASFVQFLLGDVDDILSKHRPFLWKSAYDYKNSDSPSPNRFQGLFQGRLVVQTFLEHILATTSIDEDYQLDESAGRPIGTLIMSIQAVHRILLYSTGGKFQPPASKAGAFSKINWGDYDVVSQQGIVTTVKHSSVFLKRIQGLKDQQWDDIYKAAIENREGGLAKQGDSANGNDEGADSSDDDDELLDPLYDEIPAYI